MIAKTIKPKRGTSLTHEGKEVWLYIIKPNGNYLVSDDRSFGLEANYTEVAPAELKSVAKARTSISKAPKKLTPEEKAEKADLNEFYELMASHSPHNCQECGMPLNAFTSFSQRCITSHILPKNDDCFPTLAINPENILFLGAAILGWCSCHDTWDANIDSRVKMKVYPIALEKYHKHLKDNLTGEEQVRAEKYLNIA